SNSVVKESIISDNEIGIHLASSDNLVYHNVIISNGDEIVDVGGNTWGDPVDNVGNFWGTYWGQDDGSNGRPAGDFVGDTLLPAEGVDFNPLLDPSKWGGGHLCGDWWHVTWLVWRGGWSPVTIQLTDPYGRVISAQENQIGREAFYLENETTVPGTKLVQVLIHPCFEEPFEGVYSFEMTALADLDYDLQWFAGGTAGEPIFHRSVKGVPLQMGQTHTIELRVAMDVDPATGRRVLTILTSDSDGDGITDDVDNCPTISNPDQADLDADGVGDACDPDADNDGFTPSEGDCDDMDASVRPGAPEVCDGRDNDCDGQIDEGGVCGPWTEISSCMMIDSPGNYKLTGDIAGTAGPCIEILCDDVVLEGDGYKLLGDGSGDGVVIHGNNNVVQHLFVLNHDRGIVVESGDGNQIVGHRISNNNIGVSLSATSNSVVKESIISDNGIGMYLASSDNFIYHNVIIKNGDEIVDVGGNTWQDPVQNLGNFWGTYWGQDDGSNGRPAGDFVGDTLLPAEGVDFSPVVHPWVADDSSAAWWHPILVVWRGGWSPVTIQLTDPYGRIVSAQENQIGMDAFYVEDETTVPGTKLVQVLIHPCFEEPFEGVYSFEMTALDDLDYDLEWFAYDSGEVIFHRSVKGVPLQMGQTHTVEMTVAMDVDPATGQRVLRILTSDSDRDGIADDVDNCPTISNPDQNDSDRDGVGDICDEDFSILDPAGPNGVDLPVPTHDRQFVEPANQLTDLNGDGIVDNVDLSILAACWLGNYHVEEAPQGARRLSGTPHSLPVGSGVARRSMWIN
ncbi:MAG: thrombospondin type 3 repeat-containing protein, partial [Sedimentisphaerales bacterium]|nr:thrombospondin type 3 repeat-containing protein [Sedimentisphaerales bacterium]